MKRKDYSLKGILTLAALVLLWPASHAAQAEYTVTDLGTLRADGSGNSSAYAINAAGAVAGVADTSEGSRRTFLWESGTGMIDLGTRGVTFGGDKSTTLAINGGDPLSNSGYIAGEASTPLSPGGTSHAFVFGPHGITDLNGLGPFHGGQNSRATGVNSSGQVAGMSEVESGVFHAFRYDANASGMEDLGTLGGPTSRANGINDLGEIVGAADLAGGATHGVCWSPFKGTVQIFLRNGQYAEAFAINDYSVVVGSGSGSTKGSKNAFISDLAANKTTVLSSLPGATVTQALAINNFDQVVGTSGNSSNGSERAVMWQAGAITDLNTLLPASSGWVLHVATGINDAGQIIGTGSHNGNLRAFLLTPQGPQKLVGYNLQVQPTKSWTLDAGEINPPCKPANPFEKKFVAVLTPGGKGVERECAARGVSCCTCTRRSKSFPLHTVLNTSNSHIRGYFVTRRGAKDPYSLASMRIDLYRKGVEVAKRLYAEENRPNNNCAGSSELPAALLLPPLFNVALSSIAPGIQFDEVRIRLNGYACETGTNYLWLANVQILVQ